MAAGYGYNQNSFMGQYGGMAGMDAMSSYGNMGQQSAQGNNRGAGLAPPNMGGAAGFNNMSMNMAAHNYGYGNMGGMDDSNGANGWGGR